MATVIDGASVTAHEDERSELQEISKMLDEAQQATVPKLVSAHGEELSLPESLFHLLRQAVGDLARGQMVTLVSYNKELTTQQAANLLNVSRPYLIKLLEGGEIPFLRTGTHRRILFADVMEYKGHRDAARRKGLANLTQTSQELGLYND
jgi:excisionase family DNA binding protein